MNFFKKSCITLIAFVFICNAVSAAWTDTKSSGDAILSSDWNAMVQATWDGSSGDVYRTTGSVGIGTTDPNRKLQIHDSTGAGYLQMTSSTSGVTSSDGLEFSIGTDASIWNYETGYLRLGTANTEWMRILSGGNVGIGTTAPTSKIHGVAALSVATGNEIAYTLDYTTNKATSGNDTGLKINMTDTASPGTSYLIDAQVGGASKFYVDNAGEANATTLSIGGTAITSTAAELNILDGVTSTAAELNILDGVTSTAAELNILDGVTATMAELNYVDGVTSAIQTQLGTKEGTLTNSAGLLAALSDETGTGVAVFGTTPTFTTSLFAPLFIGGTATTSDLSLQTTSGVGATGADMHFLVGAAGATEAVTILNSGNVGIGTTAPSHPLDVNGIINATALYVNGSPYIGSQWTTATNDIHYTTGKVGIGTTAPAYALDVTGTVNATTFSIGTTAITSTAAELNILDGVTATMAELNYVDGVTSAIQTQLDAKEGTLTNSAGLLAALSDETGTGVAVFSTTPTLTTPVLGVAAGTSLDLGATTLLASRALTIDTGGVFDINLGTAAGDDFTIDTSAFVVEGDTGNVGIGTASPAAKLHLSSTGAVNIGNIVLSTPATNTSLFGANLVIDDAGDYTTPASNISGGGIEFVNKNNAGEHPAIKFLTAADNNLLAVIPVERMVIDSTGNVGIGTAVPDQLLHIKGSTPILAMQVTGDAQSSRIYFKDTVGNNDGSILYDITNQQLDISTNGIGSVDVSIDSSGNVGIGTTAPGAKLHVYTTSGDAWIKAQSTTNGAGLQMVGSTGNLSSVYQYGGSDDVRINTGGTDRIVVQTAGNVGIGTTAPGAKLEVNGDVKATSFTYSSDRTLKENISTIGDALSKIQKLEGVSFDWKENGKTSLGFIAQDIEKVFPDLVTTSEIDGLKSVQYGNLVAPIVEALKELATKGDDLFDKYIDQQKRIDDLELRLQALEKINNE